MKKILISKKDSVPKVVEKILESAEKEIILVISPNSELKESLSNFELIKREAEAAGKEIHIDSSDEEVVEMAEKADIQTELSANGKDRNSRMMSDIVSLNHAKKEKPGTEQHPSEPARKLKVEENKSGESFWTKAKEESLAKKQFAEKIGEPPPQEKHKKREHPRFRWRAVAYPVLAVLIFVAGTGWAVGAFWGKAEVSISFKKTPWQYNGTITASKTFLEIDAARGYLPAEVFRQQKNATRLFPGSGTAQVSQKSTANILIYNAYGSSKQMLVASTRFAAPDGKIFRLDSQVVVPGAGIKDGKIIPSSIEASVTADKAGTDYNVGPFDKMTIPGFKGTPRYEGFYGVMAKPATGGFVGQRRVATDQDIASAKDKTSQGLKDALQGGLLNNRPENFNILDGASSVNITKLNVNKSTDDNGNFSVFGEASFQAIGFKNDGIKSLVESLMLKDYPNMTFTDLKLDYKNVKSDFAAGQLTFSVAANGVLGPKFSGDDLKSKIAGKRLDEARTAVIGLPDVSSARISLWPFWMTKLPKNPDKINVIWN
ncbi:MAG: hypothetical protein AAB536_01915 [Patescibacteria group bacterium]